MGWTSSLHRFFSKVVARNLQHARDKVVQDRLELIVYVIWMLWKTRNLWMFNYQMRTERDTIEQAVVEWIEFKELEKGAKHAHANVELVENTKSLVEWRITEVGCVKV